MKQLLQSARTGEIQVADVPSPATADGCVLVRVAASLVSAGTERAAAEFASKSLVKKAKARPDLVKQVLNKVRRDGVLSAVDAVRSRLDEPLPLGYSSAGTVIEAGVGIDDLRPGDRVACAGAGQAVHAEFACVPRMLVARIPSAEIDFESAAFTTLGAVALHGVRIAEARLGEVVAVIGLGLLGQLAVQILNAAGCRVVGIDLLQERSALAVRYGASAATTSANEFRDLCLSQSNGYGVDAVVIAAETASSGPVNMAAEVVRDRGIVVAVGAVGMELERRPYYEKEINFRVSRSYGPGRYDAAFEQKGRDYPIGYVRWSETRNMEAFLRLVAERKVHLGPLISHRFAIENATSAYDMITGRVKEPHLGVILEYAANQSGEIARLQLIRPRGALSKSKLVKVGLLGAGNFARGVLVPAMRRDPITELTGICTTNGARAHSLGRKFGFEFCTTDEDEIFGNPSINTIVIATRHHLHAAQVKRAIASGKNVFCEKPLCILEDDLQEIQELYRKSSDCRLMIGFNRRFAPMAKSLRSFLAATAGPFTMIYRVNAGTLPTEHWINDPEEGGGRILGEVCHFVDLLSFLCDATPVSVRAQNSATLANPDVTATIAFSDGSVGTIVYASNGDRAFSKERIEVFGGSGAAVLDDFRRLNLVRNGKKQSLRSWLEQNKGHITEWQEFSECIRTGSPSPISFDEIAASTLATIRIVDSLRSGRERELHTTAAKCLAAPLVS